MSDTEKKMSEGEFKGMVKQSLIDIKDGQGTIFDKIDDINKDNKSDGERIVKLETDVKHLDKRLNKYDKMFYAVIIAILVQIAVSFFKG